MVVTYDWELALVGNDLLGVGLEQNVFRFQVSVREFDRVQKLDCLQRLHRDLPYLANLEPLIPIVLNEVVKALAKGLEDKTHVVRVAMALPGPIREGFLKVDDAAITTTLLLQVFQNRGLKLGAVCVSGDGSDDFHGVDLVLFIR